MSNFIAIICGLKSEADVVRNAIGGDGIHIFISGANARRAEELAAKACAGGARAVVSVGVSGGLDPALAPGDLIIGDRVNSNDGSVYASDLGLLKSLAISPASKDAKIGALFGADEIIASAEEKSALFGKHACLAVDMESHGAARAAARAGVPFIAIRAIADPADRALPKAALGAVADDGSTRFLKTLGAALGDPKQFPELIKLGSDSNTALKALRRNLGGFFDALLLSLDL